MHKKNLKIVKKFKELVSKKVKAHEVRIFGLRARDDAAWESDIEFREAGKT